MSHVHIIREFHVVTCLQISERMTTLKCNLEAHFSIVCDASVSFYIEELRH